MFLSQDCSLEQKGYRASEGPRDYFGHIDEGVYEQAAASLNVRRENIEDIYPCTPLQEALITLSSAGSGAYVKRIVVSLVDDIDIDRFCAAVEALIKSTAVLRTRIVQSNRVGLVQVVVSEAVEWSAADSPERYLETSQNEQWGIGDPLLRNTLIRNSNSNICSFVWTIHHAIYDGWSFPLMVDRVNQAYQGNLVGPSLQYREFVKYIMEKNQLNDTRQYWRETLAGNQSMRFPVLPKASYMPVADKRLEQPCSSMQKVQGLSRTTLLRGAWAVILSQCNENSDVVFGTIVSGRNESIHGIQSLIGPTVATVPVRIRTDGDRSVQEYLEGVQEQALAMASSDQLGLHNILKLSEDARQACNFQTLLVVQPDDDAHTVTNESGTWQRLDADVGRSSYALTVQCFLNKNGIRLVAFFDSSVVDEWKVQKMLDQFEAVTKQLADSQASHSLVDIKNTISQRDLQDIWTWNAAMPQAENTCVHKIISSMACRQPEKQAVCGWDGNFTYRQLDDLSTRLAYQLVNRGVDIGSKVPLCFEKSKWTSIAMLGVMKAGGVSIAMDTTQPEDRLRSIVDQLGAKLIVSSKSNQSMAKRMMDSRGVVVAETSSTSSDPPSTALTGSVLPNVQPSDQLMILFTSGSTGKPKGTIIPHSSFSTAIQHHGPAFGIDADERIYDFASYSFDISWFNVLQAFSHGACLCVPSETERKNDLEGSISRYNASFLFLTPSVARLLNAANLPHIRCIALGGEPQCWSDFSSWPAHVKKVSVYGPAECTVVSAATDANILQHGDQLIGRGQACANWILTTDDNPTLAPVGTTGELYIEGPIVGQGYLNSSTGDASAFLEDPLWLLRGAGGSGHPGRRGRLYKTGDLAQYRADGTLAFMGRKDNQVKIRGQRVELNEVEHHVRQYIMARSSGAFDGQVIAEVIQKEDGKNPRLGVFTFMGKTISQTERRQSVEDSHAVIQDLTSGLEEHLADIVPAYMIPSEFISLDYVPMTNNGKIDRLQLRDIGKKTNRRYTSATAERILRPANKKESFMLEIWAKVLSVKADDISTDMSFVKLGGDSISAMQIVSHCRAQDISITVADVMRSQTIQQLANLYTCDSASTPDENNIERSPWHLSPMQKALIEPSHRASTQSVQTLVLKMKSPLSGDAIGKALQAVVSHHPMLRARFRINENGVWEQWISDDDCDMFSFSEHSLEDEKQMDKHKKTCQETINILEGPVFAANLFNTAKGEQFIMLAAHELVADPKSWDILQLTLEKVLTSGKSFPNETTSYSLWCQSPEAGDPSSLISRDDFHSISKPDWSLRGSSMERRCSLSHRYTKTLNSTTSNLLMGRSNRAFKTIPTDIIAATLLHAFPKISIDCQPPSLMLCYDSRRPSSSLGLDVSATVGNFLTTRPLQIPSRAVCDLLHSLKLSKESRRCGVDLNEIYYDHNSSDSTRMLGVRKDLNMILDTTSMYDQPGHANDRFQVEKQDFRSHCFAKSSSPSASGQIPSIAINVYLIDGCINISFEINSNLQHVQLLQKWTAEVEQQLEQFVYTLASRATYFTPSDFPLLRLNIEELDNLLGNLSNDAVVTTSQIQDMYPCTPLQEGILLSVSKGASSYANYFVWDCVAKNDKTILPCDLEEAWKKVVANHAILSTAFVQFLAKGIFVQVLLQDHAPRIMHLTSGCKLPSDSLHEQERPTFEYGQPEHTFTICQSSNGKVSCRLDISHVLIDATSISMIIHDLTQAYAHEGLSPTAPFSAFVHHCISEPQSRDVIFWKQALEGSQRCWFPTMKAQPDLQQEMSKIRIDLPDRITSGIFSYCQDLGITRSVFVQIAWSLVLSKYTGLHEVCFGYATSNRDAPIDHIQNTIGPLINVLVSRVDLGQTISNVVSTTFRQSVEQLQFPNASIAEVQRELGLGTQPLFNTAISVRESRQLNNINTDLQLKGVYSAYPDEVSLIHGHVE